MDHFAGGGSVLSMQINKTDRNDAYGLAQIMRTGWYREVGVKSLDGHKVRAILGARAQLVGMRTDLRNQTRGLLKIFGIILDRHGGKSFEARVMQVAQDDGIPGQSLQALLAILTSIERQLDRLNRIASNQARVNPICRNLMTIPGVGALTAVAFVAAIEDPRKFAKSTSVGAYFGLTPKRYQSGETDLSGRVSKCGDGLVRVYLYEAANSLLVGCRKWSSLKAWGMRIAKRSGMNKARVAVARKLAGRSTMAVPKFIEIDGKRIAWREILQCRRDQIQACAEPGQTALFELREDHRPASDRSAAGRYLEASLFTLLDGEG